MARTIEYLVYWFVFMIGGPFGAIAVSIRVAQSYSPEADLLAGMITLMVCWGIAFYFMNLSFKEMMK